MIQPLKTLAAGTIASIMLALGVAGCEPPTQIEFEEETAEDFYADLPAGTFLLQPEEQAEVSDSVERFYDLKPAIEIILEHSPPLPDFYGQGIYDNDEFLEGLDDIISRYDFYLPNDRVVGFYMEDLDAETANLEFDVNAIFFYDPKSEDYRTAYVGFNMDYFPPRTCTTVHEPIHSVQEGHSEEMEEAIIEVSQQKETSWEDISYLASVARKMEDLAYITTYLIDPTAVFKGYVKEDAEDCEDNAFAYYSQEEWVELAKQYECLEVYSAGYETSDQGITKVLEHFYDTGVELYELNCEQE